MSKTYTFPTLNLISGDYSIFIKTSLGSGTATLTEKYFTDIQITEETDYYGGDLVLPSATFHVENDVDDFFKSNVFTSLSPVDDSTATISVAKNNKVLFIGTIKPETITETSWLMASDDLFGDNKYSFDFTATSIFESLKYKKIQDLRTSMSLGRTRGETLDDQFYPSVVARKLSDIFSAASTLINTQTGVSIDIKIDPLFDYTFITRNDFEINLYQYELNLLNLTEGRLFNAGKISDIYFPIYVEGDLSGILNDSSDFNKTWAGESLRWRVQKTPFQNVFELLFGLIKGIGFIPIFVYNSAVSITINLTSRQSGLKKQMISVLTNNDVPYSLVIRDSIKINCARSNNSYDYQQYSFQLNTFSYDTKFDISLPVSQDVQAFKMCLPTNKKTNLTYITRLGAQRSGKWYSYLTVQNILSGKNLISNGLITPGEDSQLAAWTQVGTWDWDTYRGAQVTLTNSISSIKKDLDAIVSGDYNVLIKFEVFSRVQGTIVYVYFLDEDGNELDSEARVFDSVLAHQTGLDFNILTFSSKKNAKLKSVKIGFYDSTNSAQYAYVNNIQIFNSSDSLPEHLGKITRNNFMQLGTNIKENTCNGIQDDINLCDYQEINSEKYYFKKRTFKLFDNETDFELINYKI